jgi:hypothetical protein
MVNAAIALQLAPAERQPPRALKPAQHGLIACLLQRVCAQQHTGIKLRAKGKQQACAFFNAGRGMNRHPGQFDMRHCVAVTQSACSLNMQSVRQPVSSHRTEDTSNRSASSLMMIRHLGVMDDPLFFLCPKAARWIQTNSSFQKFKSEITLKKTAHNSQTVLVCQTRF